jgi:serine/threonine protein kinase
MVLGHVLDFSCEVGSIAELDGVLKMEFAIQEFKMSGSTKRAEMICGFESVNENSITDYQLSLKNQPVLQEKYYLRPIFVEVPRGTVKLSDFKLVRCLGSGGFSLVYLARDNWTGQYLALKMIDKKFILES